MKDEAAAAAVEAFWTMARALPSDVMVRAKLDPEFPERYSRVYEQKYGQKPPAHFMVQAIRAHTHNLEGRLAQAREQIKQETIAKALAARRLEKAMDEAESRAMSERIEQAEAERERQEKAEHEAFVKSVAAEVAAIQPVAKAEDDGRIGVLANAVLQLFDTIKRMRAPKKVHREVVRDANGDIAHVIETQESADSA